MTPPLFLGWRPSSGVLPSASMTGSRRFLLDRPESWTATLAGDERRRTPAAARRSAGRGPALPPDERRLLLPFAAHGAVGDEPRRHAGVHVVPRAHGRRAVGGRHPRRPDPGASGRVGPRAAR